MNRFMLNLALCLMFVYGACFQLDDSIEVDNLKDVSFELTNRTLTQKDFDELDYPFNNQFKQIKI